MCAAAQKGSPDSLIGRREAVVPVIGVGAAPSVCIDRSKMRKTVRLEHTADGDWLDHTHAWYACSA